MAESTAVDALKKGMELEQKGIKFYRDAAARAQDVLGKTMFESLAHDEADHLTTIRKQLEALQSGQGWIQDTGAHESPASLDEPLFPPTKAEMEAKISAGADDLGALHFALELEHNAFQHYASAAKEVSDPAGKAMYEYLAGLERGHFDLLMLNYESLASGGRFLGAHP